MTDIQERLDDLRERGLHRRMRLVSGPQGPRVLLDGKPVLLLCSNNYLGLADHPRVREAAADAAMRWGVGAGASRLVSGNMTVHRRLESELADFKRRQACLLFGSGYLANAGIVAALAREGDVVLSDALNHASIVDGCRLAKARTFVYDHCDLDHLEHGLREAAGRASLIVTDGVFACFDADMAEYLVNCARTLIFSTALPPPAVAGALAALDILRSQPERVDKLQRGARVLRQALADEGVSFGDSETQIVPLVVGDAAAAMSACERALARGVFAQAIRPPTVPEGTSRLRLAVMASHTAAELRQAAKVLAAVVPAQPRPVVPAPEAAQHRSGVFDGLAEAA